ncbi:UNKNOWN [Stylonychia lemnae]|uniref:Uncharacterized protein n=1 Tax=Stylonychia lemnae TaxID=5949 RepID=A0A078AYW0_STYLE|nr:UNKNOWN [Stylonychia lemnae]|eukprot:CDW85978.1 UNKNOWN [Stylonychia lemnae]
MGISIEQVTQIQEEIYKIMSLYDNNNDLIQFQLYYMNLLLENYNDLPKTLSICQKTDTFIREMLNDDQNSGQDFQTENKCEPYWILEFLLFKTSLSIKCKKFNYAQDILNQIEKVTKEQLRTHQIQIEHYQQIKISLLKIEIQTNLTEDIRDIKEYAYELMQLQHKILMDDSQEGKLLQYLNQRVNERVEQKDKLLEEHANLQLVKQVAVLAGASYAAYRIYKWIMSRN